MKDFDRGKDIDRPFETADIPIPLIDDIRAMLSCCKSRDDIGVIFDNARHEQSIEFGQFDDIVNALREATKALRERTTDE